MYPFFPAEKFKMNRVVIITYLYKNERLEEFKIQVTPLTK